MPYARARHKHQFHIIDYKCRFRVAAAIARHRELGYWGVMNTTHQWSSLAVVALALATTSCGKSGGGGKSAGPELFAGGIAPPGDLIKVKAGMTIDDVKKVLPTAAPCARQSGSPCLEIASGYSSLRFKIGFYSDLQTVAGITVASSTKGELAALATKAWGPGVKTGEGSFASETWRDDNTGFIASTSFERDIEFKTFVPLNAGYFGAKPGIVGPWKGITFGMTRDEVLAKVPRAVAPKGGGSFNPMSGGPEGVVLEPKFGDDDDKVNQLTLRFPADVGALLEKAWGPGVKVGTKIGVGSQTESTSISTYWFDAAAGLRFVSNESGLVIEPYLTYEALLGAGKDDFGMLPVAVIGKSKAEVAAHYKLAASTDAEITVRLANSELSSEYSPPQINCKFTDDKANCSLDLKYGEQTSERDAILALVKAKWGEPKMVFDDMQFRTSKPKIVVRDWVQMLTFTIEP